MIRSLAKLPDPQKGLMYIVVGIVALLYALGFFTKGITIIIVVCALYAIVKGIVKIGLYDKIVHAMNKK